MAEVLEPTIAQVIAAAEAIWLEDAPRSGNEPLAFSTLIGWQRESYLHKARAAIGAYLMAAE